MFSGEAKAAPGVAGREAKEGGGEGGGGEAGGNNVFFITYFFFLFSSGINLCSFSSNLFRWLPW